MRKGTGASAFRAHEPTAKASPGTAAQRPENRFRSSRFYIARPGVDTAASINAQLAHGKDLLFTPGIYDLTEPIRVTRPNTVVMGLGFATLQPTSTARRP